jgi:hypothetical protein
MGFVKMEGGFALVVGPTEPGFVVVFAPCSVPGKKGFPPKERETYGSLAAAEARVREVVFGGFGHAYVENHPARGTVVVKGGA